MRLRHGRSLVLWFSVLVLMVVTFPVGAAPPAYEVQVTERVTGNGELTNSSTGFRYLVDFFAERGTNNSDTQMWMEVHVEVYNDLGVLVDSCGDGAEVDPGLFEIFEDDLSHAFLHSGGEPISGSLGSGCFWQSISVDTHLFGEGRLLRGNTHQRDPGRVCNGHNQRRTASVEAHFGFGAGPEGPFGIHELDRGDPTTGEIFYDVTRCHATGRPGPAL